MSALCSQDWCRGDCQPLGEEFCHQTWQVLSSRSWEVNGHCEYISYETLLGWVVMI